MSTENVEAQLDEFVFKVLNPAPIAGVGWTRKLDTLEGLRVYEIRLPAAVTDGQ